MTLLHVLTILTLYVKFARGWFVFHGKDWNVRYHHAVCELYITDIVMTVKHLFADNVMKSYLNVARVQEYTDEMRTKKYAQI